jgi:hypothetical protein
MKRTTRKGEAEMYCIGLEDIIANAMIEVLEERQSESNSNQCKQCNTIIIAVKDLEEYGKEVLNYINRNAKYSCERALVTLSEESVARMYRNYSDFFVKINSKDNQVVALRLSRGKTLADLKKRFRRYQNSNVVNAFKSEKALNILRTENYC